ncbi:MAG TPA: GAF domain-containing sensor histidine kinase [Puia sp.]|nr:GAF domain-containing sensor histidine kinase [Puia sp.]
MLDLSGNKTITLTPIPNDVENISQIPIIPSLLEVICRTTGMGFAVVARVTGEKWVACSVRDEILFGIKTGEELKPEITICSEIRQTHQPVVIEFVQKDFRFRDHPMPRTYGFQSYISFPIFRKDGSFFGTLCAVDTKPHRVNTPEITGMFNLFTDLISFHLQTIEQSTVGDSELNDEQVTSRLREQFIAILGHDLRNPLSAITFSSELLLELPLDKESVSLVNIIKKSAGRMTRLIKNTLDFANGRLGGGIILNRSKNEPLQPFLEQVIEEYETVRPDVEIIARFDLKKPVYCDNSRIADLFSNLLGNALLHGKTDAPVYIDIMVENGEFSMSVANSGDKIPENLIGQIFRPFSRGQIKKGHDGLGLGLFIASEIAEAHGGQIEVISDETVTRFTFTMPADADVQ